MSDANWDAIDSERASRNRETAEILKRMKEPNYQGFVRELWEREKKGFPIDRTLLEELSQKYNTPIV